MTVARKRPYQLMLREWAYPSMMGTLFVHLWNCRRNFRAWSFLASTCRPSSFRGNPIHWESSVLNGSPSADGQIRRRDHKQPPAKIHTTTSLPKRPQICFLPSLRNLVSRTSGSVWLDSPPSPNRWYFKVPPNCNSTGRSPVDRSFNSANAGQTARPTTLRDSLKNFIF